MQAHLWGLKKLCPALVSSTTLTEEVKEWIITNRRIETVSKPEEPPKQNHITVNQSINQFNTINNFVANLDTIEKIQKYMTHQQLSIIDFESMIESMYETQVDKLVNDKFRFHTFTLGNSDIMNIVNEASSAKEIENLNVIYDKEHQRIKIYEGGTEWIEYLPEQGATKYIETIVDYFLEEYEKYLIRKMESPTVSSYQKAGLVECLGIYYTLLSCFQLEPYAKNHNDTQILFNPDDPRYQENIPFSNVEEHRLTDKYTALYNSYASKVTRSIASKMKKDVIDVIKSNSTRNIKELNIKIVTLIQMDNEFKQTLL
jgi:hypothetical protein